MTFRPFNSETLAEMAAIQAEIVRLSVDPDKVFAEGQIARLERERDAIYQADYDLSRQHR